MITGNMHESSKVLANEILMWVTRPHRANTDRIFLFVLVFYPLAPPVVISQP